MIKMAEYLFGDIVVVDEDQIGVIVKTWEACGVGSHGEITYEVYVRNYNDIREYPESEVKRYRIRHKYLDEQELEWQKGG